MIRMTLRALVLSALFSTPALATNWVKTPPNSTGMTAMYDADSAYLEMSTGLVYVTTCGDEACVTRTPGDLFGPRKERVDCATRSIANFDGQRWGAPFLPGDEYSMNDNEYRPETDAAMTVQAMCSNKDSWPKH
jgi:hypothetical protein